MLRTVSFIVGAIAVVAATVAGFDWEAEGASRSQAEIDLTGTWDVAGVSGTVQFNCVMELVHGPIPTPATPTPSPAPTPSTQPVLIDDLSGTIQCSGGGIPSSSADIRGSVDELTRHIEFTVEGLFGCGASFGSAGYSADGNSMSGTFECTPQTIASWVATRRLASETPTPTPTPTHTSTATPVPTPTKTPTPTLSPTPSPIPTATPCTGNACPSITPTPTPTPTATPLPFKKGNVDCSTDGAGVTSVDSLKILREVAGLSVTQNEPCDDIGTSTPMQGDINCDGNITSVDALFILRYVAQLTVNLPGDCTPIWSVGQ